MILKASVIFFLVLQCSSAILFPSLHASTRTQVINVPTDFPTIQSAINSASDGDTIFVHQGTYNENLVANKTISLVGENNQNTVIDGGGSGTVIRIIAENVSIENFTVRGGGSNSSESGILVASSSSNITGNIITRNGLFGICINYSSYAFVSANIIEQNGGDGIVLLDSFNNTFLDNAIGGNSIGLHLYASDQNNTLTENTLGGINFFYSSSNLVKNNSVMGNNGQGIILDYSSDNNILTKNSITATVGNGLTIGSCSNNTLRNNVLSANTYNFYCPAARPNLSDFLNDVDTSNTVDGHPIYYIVNQRGLFVGPPAFTDIGYLALINCTNMIVQDIILSGNGQGLFLSFTNNTVIKQIKASKNDYGIQLLSSLNNTIINSTLIDNNKDGITLDYSTNNIICHNTEASSSNGIRVYHESNENLIDHNVVTNNAKGLWVNAYCIQNTVTGNILTGNNQSMFITRASDKNIITKNTMANNSQGVYFSFSSQNVIINNNFINNAVDAVSLNSTNIWDGGPSDGGNFWSNYTGIDLDHDGLGEETYTIDADNIDNHPLAGNFQDFKVITEHGEEHVQIVSNSTVNGFEVLWWLSSPNQYLQPGQKYIHFTVTSAEGTMGFCRATIPRTVLNGTYIVLVDWQEIPAMELIVSNATHACIYFDYVHSPHEVIIIAEFPLATPILLAAMIVTFVFTMYKRKHSRLTD